MLKSWDSLPKFLQKESIKAYYQLIARKKIYLFFKRVMDIILSLLLFLPLLPLFLLISIVILFDSPGSPFFLQTRVTRYGREFKIIKFRTMQKNADKIGTAVTVDNDPRVTRSGVFLRKYRLDEIPQLINIFLGDMTFVGTRPEVPKYVEAYTEEMLATLLLPAGVTSLASAKYKDEQKLLDNSDHPEETYINKVLPQKMEYNLSYLKSFSFFEDIKIILYTLKEIFS